MSAGLSVLVAGIVIGIICAVVGIGRVLLSARPLKERVDAYRDLPVVRLAETTQTRVVTAQRRIAEAPLLSVRAQRAVLELVTAGRSVCDAARTVPSILRAVPALLFGR